MFGGKTNNLNINKGSQTSISELFNKISLLIRRQPNDPWYLKLLKFILALVIVNIISKLIKKIIFKLTSLLLSNDICISLWDDVRTSLFQISKDLGLIDLKFTVLSEINNYLSIDF